MVLLAYPLLTMARIVCFPYARRDQVVQHYAKDRVRLKMRLTANTRAACAGAESWASDTGYVDTMRLLKSGA